MLEVENVREPSSVNFFSLLGKFSNDQTSIIFAEIYFYASCDGCSAVHRNEDSLEWKEVKGHYSDSWGGTCTHICACRTVSVLWFQRLPKVKFYLSKQIY